MNADWRPACALDTARLRARLLARARQWFEQSATLEVQTPALDRAAVSDVNIESVAVTVHTLRAPHYLHTSPEYAMKRLLAAGYPDIYQVCTVFRDGEIGPRHQPEFTMVEWYRHGMDLDAIVADTLALTEHMLEDTPGAPGATAEVHRYDDALLAACGVTSTSNVATLRDAAGADMPESIADDPDALLDYLFACRVAPAFDTSRLTVVTHYPASQAALARLDPKTGSALRFEVFYGALELANGFVELTDADQQRQRFESDLARRRARGLPVRPIDTRFLDALSHGLPDCAGVALGFDRLLMKAAGAASIAAVNSFPHSQEH